jgi:sulfatase modifying factor 1
MLARIPCILLFFFMLNVNVNIGFCSKRASPDMVLVKGGTFRMGSSGGPAEEGPIHTVTLAGFHMGKFEVTQEEWKRVMGNNPSFFKGDNLPVSDVDWYDAVKYCNKRSKMEGLTPCYTGSGDEITCNFDADGYRLATEAEWEYAARGGQKSRNYLYSGSNNADEVAWYERNSGFEPHPVGQLKPNELGIYDMSGNIWEWCWEWYDKGYYRKSPSSNPGGPASPVDGKVRSYRGGGCCGRKILLRNTARFSQSSSFKRFDMGFRVVKKASGKLPEDMVRVEGGPFKMGSEEGGDRGPVRPVTVRTFYIAKYEVTQEEWYNLMGYNPSFIQGALCPVDRVRWWDVLEYCNKLSQKQGLTPCYKIDGETVTCNFAANGFRLPTEAEWEFACRGGNESGNFKYSGSNQAEEVGWYVKNTGFLPQPVGQLKPNELGIYDMSGNVMEWCWDWYDRDYYRNSPAKAPKGPSSGIRKVARGGGIFRPANLMECSYRSWGKPYCTVSGLGFRLARTVENGS